MKMHIGGQWIDGNDKIVVHNPFDGSTVDTVPRGTLNDVEIALATAVRGAEIMRCMSGFKRYQLLRKAADILTERQEEFAQIITLEEGKTLPEARFEASRAIQTITGSSEEAKRLYGETIPLDGAPDSEGKFGFTLRVPCGVVVAITPFNFPLNLVAHKVGPALAAGNSVIVKPASDTPLSALKLVEIMLEAGIPPEAVQCITGSGGEIGDALCSDARVRKISFTGSKDVGEHICHIAGIKKVTMELGSNSPLIVMPDADLQKVAQATVATGFSNAGQVCISTQRVLADATIYTDYLDALQSKVLALNTGNPQKNNVQMGPMIREDDAIRVNDWIKEATSSGANVIAGGERNGTMHQPTVVANVDPSMRISCEEVFGPAVAVTRTENIEQSISLANDTNYGLSAAIFTENINSAMKFAREVHSGNLMVNWGPQWRADLMPYGGLKDSGLGKEGPKYAVEEMTETKMVVFHT